MKLLWVPAKRGSQLAIPEMNQARRYSAGLFVEWERRFSGRKDSAGPAARRSAPNWWLAPSNRRAEFRSSGSACRRRAFPPWQKCAGSAKARLVCSSCLGRLRLSRRRPRLAGEALAEAAPSAAQAQRAAPASMLTRPHKETRAPSYQPLAQGQAAMEYWQVVQRPALGRSWCSTGPAPKPRRALCRGNRCIEAAGSPSASACTHGAGSNDSRANPSAAPGMIRGRNRSGSYWCNQQGPLRRSQRPQVLRPVG
jgi:hypothetical protein